jgi:HJR/Mrr/RecB family endonuclease
LVYLINMRLKSMIFTCSKNTYKFNKLNLNNFSNPIFFLKKKKKKTKAKNFVPFKVQAIATTATLEFLDILKVL